MERKLRDALVAHEVEFQFYSAEIERCTKATELLDIARAVRVDLHHRPVARKNLQDKINRKLLSICKPA